ncbi:MAG: hypothetical protein V1912_11165 [bacterium]
MNYAKGLGNYCTYGDSRQVLVGVLRALAVSYPSLAETLSGLLPAGVKGLLTEAVRSPDRVDHTAEAPSRTDFLEVLRSTAHLGQDDRPGHALRAFFGTVKEKSQELRGEWAEVIPAPLREDWDQSITIDQVQDAGQCL